MFCNRQCLIIILISGIVISLLLGYLFNVSHGENLTQINQIRMISASMKLIKIIGQFSEILRLSNERTIQRYIGTLFIQLKSKNEDQHLEIETTMIEEIPVRIYRSLNISKDDDEESRPALIYFHGGAYYLGSYDTHNALTASLARLTSLTIISVNYRLAPEYPFPAGVNDCTKVTKYLLNDQNSKKFKINSKRLAIGGDSSGGNFAAVVAMRLSTDNVVKNFPRLVVLIYPEVQFFDFRLPSFVQPSLQIFHLANLKDVLNYYFNQSFTNSVNDNQHLTIEDKKRFRSFVNWSLIPIEYRQIYSNEQTDHIEGDPQLIKISKELLHRDASPLLADNKQLSRLPQTYILTVEHDTLRDEALIYAARLKASGVSVVHQHFPKAFHGSFPFLYGPFALDIAHQMINNIAKYLKENI